MPPWSSEKVLSELFGKGINLDTGGDSNIKYNFNVILDLGKSNLLSTGYVKFFIGAFQWGYTFLEPIGRF